MALDTYNRDPADDSIISEEPSRKLGIVEFGEFILIFILIYYTGLYTYFDTILYSF